MQPAKTPYHKENLRRDLLDAGRTFVHENGHLNLSMRTLAQRLAVSSGAPYHHFPDRRSFLLALAAEGFEDMLAGARRSMESSDAPGEKVRQMGMHFIRFAQNNPHLLDLMYESELTAPKLDPKLLEYQINAHTALRSAICAASPQISPDEADLRSIAFWSAIYGFTTMRRKGVIHSGGIAAAADDISQAIVDRAVLMAIAA